MLKKGDKIPDFDLINQDGEAINLNQFKGKKIILFFYPKSFTPGCTSEACDLNNNFDRFENLGYQIIGVSKDSIKSQKEFQEKYNFKYPLISDSDKKLIEYFGVWGKKKFMGKEFSGILRTTFIIDENGFIESVIQHVETKNHTRQILD